MQDEKGFEESSGTAPAALHPCCEARMRDLGLSEAQLRKGTLAQRGVAWAEAYLAATLDDPAAREDQGHKNLRAHVRTAAERVRRSGCEAAGRRLATEVATLADHFLERRYVPLAGTFKAVGRYRARCHRSDAVRRVAAALDAGAEGRWRGPHWPAMLEGAQIEAVTSTYRLAVAADGCGAPELTELEDEALAGRCLVARVCGPITANGTVIVLALNEDGAWVVARIAVPGGKPPCPATLRTAQRLLRLAQDQHDRHARDGNGCAGAELALR